MDALARAGAASAVVCAAATFVGLASWWRPRSAGWGRLADVAGTVALAVTLVVWGLRWIDAGHLPLFGTYESALSLAVAVLLVLAIARLRGSVPPGLWPFGCAVGAAILAHGVRYDPTAYALTISERSWVVDVHAVAAWLAFGVLALNAGIGLARVLRKPAGSDRSDAAVSRTLSLGFLLHSAMMATGSLYKFLLFGTAWTFDPIETLGFVVWMAYGTLLHLHLMGGWTGRRLAGWCLALFAILVVSYRGIVYFPAWSTYHIFDMDLRIHLTGSEEIEIPEE